MILGMEQSTVKQLKKEIEDYCYEYEKAARCGKENLPEFKAKIIAMYLFNALKIINHYECLNQEIIKKLTSETFID